MRRRRRKTQIWLPTYGNQNDTDQLDAVIGVAGTVTALPNGEIATDAFAVTFDDTQSAWQTQFQAQPSTLHDIVSGQEWSLLRIVGKYHASPGFLVGGSDPTFIGPPAVEVAAGYIVLRTDEEGNLLTNIDEHNPLAQEAADDPWIWRRKWILSNPTYRGATNSPFAGNTINHVLYTAGEAYPGTTAGYGSVADGAHIDQKTRRRIGRESRLFFMQSIRMWDPAKLWVTPAQIFNSPITLAYNLDNRFVGRLSSRMGNRGNATR